MLDNETGYDDTLVCGCKPCPKCDGEGTTTMPNEFTLYTEPGPFMGAPLAFFRCLECNGTGKDTGDCEIEAHWPLDEQIEFRAANEGFGLVCGVPEHSEEVTA